MSLERFLRTMISVHYERQLRPRRKRRKLELTRKSEEKKISETEKAVTVKKAVRESHWCSWCDTIGHPCG